MDTEAIAVHGSADHRDFEGAGGQDADAERFARQFSEGIMAGRNPLSANSPKPDRP
jgi:hypothetical protein